MIYTYIIPVLLLFAPWLLVRYVFKTKQTQNLPYKENVGYLYAAAAVWVASQVLPNVPISSQTDTFTMHTLGGAVTALLFVYAIKSYKVKFESWWQPWVYLFLFTSGLGVLNELFEFFLGSVGYPGVVSGDEWWDLAANTLGAYLAYIIIRITFRARGFKV